MRRLIKTEKRNSNLVQMPKITLNYVLKSDNTKTQAISFSCSRNLTELKKIILIVARSQVIGAEKPPPYKEIEEDEEAGGADRPQWNNQLEFLLSCIAMSVGLGNIWRFPFSAYENGGGAFLIPYLIVLFVIGKPLYFLELVIGQFSSFGCVRMWSAVPAMRGECLARKRCHQKHLCF